MNIRNFLKRKNPLTPLSVNINLCSIFRTIGCVGDSLSSGEFEGHDADGNKHYHDLYEYSWGQFMARDIGSKVYNFSKGGMTAEKYCESYANDIAILMGFFFWKIIIIINLLLQAIMLI